MSPDYEFKKIFDEYYPMISRYLTRIVGSNDAEDIAQDVFDKINSNLEGFQGKSKLSTSKGVGSPIDFGRCCDKKVNHVKAIENRISRSLVSYNESGKA